MLKDIVGQNQAKNILQLVARSYERRKILPPLGVFGASGLGKTHLVEAFCKQMGSVMVYMNGTALKDVSNFVKLIEEAGDNPGDHYIVFIDEAHTIHKRVQEAMLSVLEKPSQLSFVCEKDSKIYAKKGYQKGDPVSIPVPQNLSFIIATTDAGLLKETMLNRLRKVYLSPYTRMEKAEIARRHLEYHDVDKEQSTLLMLADRCRSIRHLKSDICETFIDICGLYPNDTVEEKLEIMDGTLGIDDQGAMERDLEYMRYLADNEKGGLDTLAGLLKVDKKEVQARIEPFLLEKGWIAITGRGRTLTEKGFQKMMAVR